MSPADGPSRRPDYEDGSKRPTTQLLETLATTTIDPFNDLIPAIKAAQDSDLVLTDMKNKIGYPDLSRARGQDKSTNEDFDMQLTGIAGAHTYGG